MGGSCPRCGVSCSDLKHAFGLGRGRGGGPKCFSFVHLIFKHCEQVL